MAKLKSPLFSIITPVLNDKEGKPIIELEKKIDLFIKKKFKVKNYKIYLSISDEMKYSIAYVILQGNSK